MSDAYCSEISRELDEPLLGTASRVRNWLLVEQPGRWGYDAVVESGLDPAAASELKRNTGRHHVRLLLIRRPNGVRESTLRCFAVHSGLDHRWIHQFEIERASDLIDLDLSGMRNGVAPDGGISWEHPLYLVCTHGDHDRCCSRFGEPVARALATTRAGTTWESSHVGGDRFAGNLVCLPHGLYFGRVSAENAARVAALYEQDMIDLEHFRGRSCFESVVQAGDVFLRLHWGLTAIDDLVPESRRDRPGGTSSLTFRDPQGRSYAVDVTVRRASKRLITCDASVPGSPRAYSATFPDGDRSNTLR